VTARFTAEGRDPVPGPPRLLPDDAWHGWFAMYDRVLVVVLAALPLAALAMWVLARRRRRAGSAPRWARRTAVTEVGLVLAMVPAL
jgi:hypothetical protein